VPDFGVLTKLPLRSVWQHEARDFTPWLAENLPALGKALGMDLEHESTEATVGEFSLDILAVDLNRNRSVVIENQITSTDHDHLGKLLTYAAGYNAGSVVWVAESLREEHRQALDWLNQNTNRDLEFYGVVVEVLRIDDSLPAFNFKVVASPNEWRKDKAANRESGRSSARGEAYRSFFQRLIDRLRDEHGFTGARVAQPVNWYGFASGYANVSYQFAFTLGNRAKVEVYLWNRDADWNRHIYDELHARKSAIENAYGNPLDWDPMEGNQGCRIAHHRHGSIEDDDQTLDELQVWAIDHLLKLKATFQPHLAEILRGE